MNITGTNNSEQLVTGSGNDTIDALDGDDTLIGGYGSDTLYGGNGNDVLGGNIADVDYAGDRLYGGAGDDTFSFYHPGASLDAGGKRDRIMDFESGDKIDLSQIDGVGWDDITIEAGHGQVDYIVLVDFAIDELDMAIEIVGVMPVQDNFVFG